MTALIGFVWNQILLGPATNFMVVLDRVFFGSFGIAILVFTLVLRLATLPLTMKQMQSSKKMQTLQPRLQEIQKKYSDPKRRSEEQMKLYKEAGVNPAGCVVPMLIQFPIWIALYQVIRITLATTPESLIDLSHRLYPWSFVQHAVPLTSHFLWLNLGNPDTTLIMPVLVFVTMWLQQKLTMTQQTMAPGSQTQQTNQMMLWFMPLIFAYFSYTLPSGLSLYWIGTNAVGIAMNYYVFGWHEKPFREVLSGASFSMASLLGAKPAQNGRKPAAGRPAPQRSPRLPAKAEDAARRNGKTVPSPAESSLESNGSGPGAEQSRAGRNGSRDAATRRRPRRDMPPPRAARPKAPPVKPPLPRATSRLSEEPAGGPDGSPRPDERPQTGRLNDDPAAGDGGAEMRPSDGRAE